MPTADGRTVQDARRRPLVSGNSSARSSSHGGSTSTTGDLNTSSTSTNALVRHGHVSAGDENLAAMLARLPSSPKDLFRRLEEQRDEIRLLREEAVRLKSREVEVSSLTLKLQQQFAATQSQVEGIKAQIHLQLANPITEEEYNKLDALPEAKRDLLDTIKLGIYRQLGSLRASALAATKRAAELAASSGQWATENSDLKLEVQELKASLEREREGFASRAKNADKQTTRMLELESTVKDLESRLRNANLDQEQFLTAKLNAQMKTDEAARLSIRLEEAEMDVQRYRANAECNEQKLDILKSEYYELKLTYSQRILELESCLKAADEKLKTLGDLEVESELFISTLAQRDRDGAPALALSSSGAGPEGSGALTAAVGGYETYLALPRSRKLAHSLVVTKRCLHLENKVATQEHDLAYKDKQIARLQVSLEAARDALKNVNSPYAMVEKTMEELYSECEKQKEKLTLVQEENTQLREALRERTADVEVLCKHRQELLRMRKLLKKLGVAEGYAFSDRPNCSRGDGDDHDTCRASGVSRSGRQASLRAPDSFHATTASATDAAAQPSSTTGSSSTRQRSDANTMQTMPGIEISS